MSITQSVSTGMPTSFENVIPQLRQKMASRKDHMQKFVGGFRQEHAGINQHLMDRLQLSQDSAEGHQASGRSSDSFNALTQFLRNYSSGQGQSSDTGNGINSSQNFQMPDMGKYLENDLAGVEKLLNGGKLPTVNYNDLVAKAQQLAPCAGSDAMNFCGKQVSAQAHPPEVTRLLNSYATMKQSGKQIDPATEKKILQTLQDAGVSTQEIQFFTGGNGKADNTQAVGQNNTGTQNNNTLCPFDNSQPVTSSNTLCPFDNNTSSINHSASMSPFDNNTSSSNRSASICPFG